MALPTTSARRRKAHGKVNGAEAEEAVGSESMKKDLLDTMLDMNAPEEDDVNGNCKTGF